VENIVLLGHGVGVKFVIESLLRSELPYKVVAVVTHPYEQHKNDIEMLEKRKDIYGEFGYNVFDVENDYHIPLLESENVNETNCINWINSFKPAYIISIGCRNIIKREFLDLFPKKVLNIHTTPLPCYRGAANDTWMILNGEWGKKKYGCIHYIDPGIDTGAIIAKEYYTIPHYSYPIDIYKIRTSTFKSLLIKGLKNLENSNFIPESQNVDFATTFPRQYTPIDGKIDFINWRGDDILKFIYAFSYPFSGAFCSLAGYNKISILEADFIKHIGFHPHAYGLDFWQK
jgi:methionyl-tRNA formyltransferase